MGSANVAPAIAAAAGAVVEALTEEQIVEFGEGS